MMMRPFSVELPDTPGKAALVLAVDGNKCLVADDERRMKWVALDKCLLGSIFFDRDETPNAPWRQEFGD